MFEPDNEDRDIISSMFRKRMLEQLFARNLCVFDVADKLDSSLIVYDIPKLKKPRIRADWFRNELGTPTPSQAKMRNSSSSQSSVSVV